jgi:hypothetical protein
MVAGHVKQFTAAARFSVIGVKVRCHSKAHVKISISINLPLQKGTLMKAINFMFLWRPVRHGD